MSEVKPFNQWDYVGGGHNLHYTFLNQSMSQKDIVWNYKSTNLDIQNTNTLYFDDHKIDETPNKPGYSTIGMFGTSDYKDSWLYYSGRITYDMFYNYTGDYWFAYTNDFSALFELGKECPYPVVMRQELTYLTKRVGFTDNTIGSKDYRNGFIYYPIVIEDNNGAGFLLGFHVEFGRDKNNNVTSSCIGKFRSFCSYNDFGHASHKIITDEVEDPFIYGYGGGLTRYTSYPLIIWIIYDGLFHYEIYHGMTAKLLAKGSIPESYRRLIGFANNSWTCRSYMGCQIVNNEFAENEQLDTSMNDKPLIQVDINYGASRWEMGDYSSDLTQDDITYP